MKTALGVKTGLWDVANSINERESSKIPPEVIDRMTPEQRADYEKTQRDQAKIPAVRTKQVCVIEKDLDAGLFNAYILGPNSGCSTTVIRSSAMHQEVRFSCPSGTNFVPLQIMTLDALSEESVRARLVNQHAGGQSVIDISGRWKGPECAAPAN